MREGVVPSLHERDAPCGRHELCLSAHVHGEPAEQRVEQEPHVLEEGVVPIGLELADVVAPLKPAAAPE